jgi:hypothetical protein
LIRYVSAPLQDWTMLKSEIYLILIATDVKIEFSFSCSTLNNKFYFSHTFRRFLKLVKHSINLVMSVRLSAWNNSAPTGRIFMKCDI